MHNLFMINSPLEQFGVVSLLEFRLPFNGTVLSLTNLGLYSIIIVVLILGGHFLSTNNKGLVSSPWSLTFESLYTTLQSMVKDQIGSRYESYLPFVYGLFIFILVANVNGNIPYGFTITTSAIVSLGFSCMIFSSVTILGLFRHGIHFFSYFVPAGTPLALVPLLVLIELISYFARAVSLGVRLFANMVAGHILLKILASFLFGLFNSSLLVATLTLIPFALFVALIGLELAVSVIQAYVFTILTCSYIKDALDLH